MFSRSRVQERLLEALRDTARVSLQYGRQLFLRNLVKIAKRDQADRIQATPSSQVDEVAKSLLRRAKTPFAGLRIDFGTDAGEDDSAQRVALCLERLWRRLVKHVISVGVWVIRL